MTRFIENYLTQIQANWQTNQATEMTYRPAMKTLLESLPTAMAGKPPIMVIHEPKHVACGAPDFVIQRDTMPLGYMETKDIDGNLEPAKKKKTKKTSRQETFANEDITTDQQNAVTDSQDIEPDQQDTDPGQIARYISSLPNFILTDYLEFRWYVQGQLRSTVRIAKTSSQERQLIWQQEEIPKLENLLTSFLQESCPVVATAEELASQMARIAQIIRDCIIKALEQESQESQAEDEDANQASSLDPITKQYQAFKKYLLPNLQPREFADLYAQTMSYGLFAAKLSVETKFSSPGEQQNFIRCEPQHVPGSPWKNVTREDTANIREASPFSRVTAYQYLASNPFLRKLFLDVADELRGTVIEPFLDDLVTILNHADMASILEDFTEKARKTKTEDAVIHFYETFLAAYNPQEKKKRGVYYTPEPVVQFIVRSVHWLLQNRLSRQLGLADDNVNILDPATGTGTFLYFVIRLIHQIMADHGQLGSWQEYVSCRLLPRLHGFELLMAPYVVAHLKLKLLLQELGYTLGKQERLRVFLTNALDKALPDSGESKQLLGSYLLQEGADASQIKSSLPIMVVLGNPPYSGHSANPSRKTKGKENDKNTTTGNPDEHNQEQPPIADLLQDYYQCDGRPLGEANPKWLQDDYVKFIRFAQWRIQKTGHGIVAFVTNHAYLDNPTFRGMRQQILGAFDELFIVNLHGNSRKKEVTPDGNPDENVFDIQQGVAILLAVRFPNPQREENQQEVQFPTQVCVPSSLAKVHYQDIWGQREEKYHWLDEFDAGNVEWQTLTPTTPDYFLIPQNRALKEEYEQGWSIPDIMPAYSTGFVTARDHLAIQWSEKQMLSVVQHFVDLPVEQARREYELGKDVQDWKVDLAQQDVRDHRPLKKYITPVLYRPFDIRYTFYTGKARGFICRPRQDIMQEMIGHANLGLLVSRQQGVSGAYCHCWVTTMPNDLHCISLRGGDNLFPLYLYHNQKNMPDSQPQVNISLPLRKALSQSLGLAVISQGKGDLTTTLGPEDVLDYMYAILHCPTYRTRYAEFLQRDFPRIPFTSDRHLFVALAQHGHTLAELHLLRSNLIQPWDISYPIPGTNLVEKAIYTSGESAGKAKDALPKNAAVTNATSGNMSNATSGNMSNATSGNMSNATSGGAVWINATQYFGNVPPKAWEFQVGGYQVCQKWLKDRKGRVLQSDDIQHYQRMVMAIVHTLRIMSQLQSLIPSFPLPLVIPSNQE